MFGPSNKTRSATPTQSLNTQYTQFELVQSRFNVQRFQLTHLKQLQPQSTSVSLQFKIPSVQLAVHVHIHA